MKIYVFNLKRVAKLLIIVLAIVCLFIATGTFMNKVTKVFANERQLPIYSVDCTEKKLAITFDCAWNADDVPAILKILRDQNVKATFFIVGLWAEKNPDMVRQIALDGHDIANHSYSHLRMGEIDNSRIRSEIQLGSKALEGITGKKVDLFRAPYGDYNNNVINIAKEMGCTSIQWDVDSLDWRPGISQDEIMSRIDTKVKNGSIILFHNDTEHTAEILSTIISNLKNRGYGFLPVSKMILKKDYYINFEGRQIQK